MRKTYYCVFIISLALFIFAFSGATDTAFAQGSVTTSDYEACRIFAFPYVYDTDYVFFAALRSGYSVSGKTDELYVAVGDDRVDGALCDETELDTYVSSLEAYVPDTEHMDDAVRAYFEYMSSVDLREYSLFRFECDIGDLDADLTLTVPQPVAIQYEVTVDVGALSEYITVDADTTYTTDGEYTATVDFADNVDYSNCYVTFGEVVRYLSEATVTDSGYCFAFSTTGVTGNRTLALGGCRKKVYTPVYELSVGLYLADFDSFYYHGESFSFVAVKSELYETRTPEVYANDVLLSYEIVDGEPYSVSSGSVCYRFIVPVELTKGDVRITSRGMEKDELTVSIVAMQGFTIEYISDSPAYEGENYVFFVRLNNGYLNSEPRAISRNGNYVTMQAVESEPYLYRFTVVNAYKPIDIAIEGAIPDVYVAHVVLGKGAEGTFNGETLDGDDLYNVTFGTEQTLRLRHTAGYLDFAFALLINGEAVELPEDIRDGYHQIVIPADYVRYGMVIEVKDGFYADYRLDVAAGEGTAMSISDTPLSEDGFRFSLTVDSAHDRQIPTVTLDKTDLQYIAVTETDSGVRYDYLISDGLPEGDHVLSSSDLQLNVYEVTVSVGDGFETDRSKYEVVHGQGASVTVRRLAGHSGRYECLIDGTAIGNMSVEGITLTEENGVIILTIPSSYVTDDIAVAFGDVPPDLFVMSKTEGIGTSITFSTERVVYGESVLVYVTIREGYRSGTPKLYVSTNGQGKNILGLEATEEADVYVAEYADVVSDCLFVTDSMYRDTFDVTIVSCDGVERVAYVEKAYYGYDYSIKIYYSTGYERSNPSVTVNGVSVPVAADGVVTVAADMVKSDLRFVISDVTLNTYYVTFFDQKGLYIITKRDDKEVVLNGKEYTVRHGDDITFWLRSIDDYLISDTRIYVDGVELESVFGSYHIESVSGDMTVTALTKCYQSVALTIREIDSLPRPEGSLTEIINASAAILEQKRFLDAMPSSDIAQLPESTLVKLDSLLDQLVTRLAIIEYSDGFLIDNLGIAVPLSDEYYAYEGQKTVRIYPVYTEMQVQKDKSVRKLLRKSDAKYVSVYDFRIMRTTVLGDVETTVDVTDILNCPLHIGARIPDDNRQYVIMVVGNDVYSDYTETPGEDGHQYLTLTVGRDEYRIILGAKNKRYWLLAVLLCVLFGLVVLYYVRKHNDKKGVVSATARRSRPTPPDVSVILTNRQPDKGQSETFSGDNIGDDAVENKDEGTTVGRGLDEIPDDIYLSPTDGDEGAAQGDDATE